MENQPQNQPQKQKLPKLTKKQKGFVKDYLISENGTQAALKNYNIVSPNPEKVASVIASENLTKPCIQEAIKSIADSIPNELLIEKHLELLNVPKKIRTFVKGDITTEYEELDSQAVSKGLDMAYKIKRIYGEEDKPASKAGNTYNLFFSKEIQEDVKKLEDRIKEKLTQKNV